MAARDHDVSKNKLGHPKVAIYFILSVVIPARLARLPHPGTLFPLVIAPSVKCKKATKGRQ
jgi:hypothetical protein